MTRPSHRHVLLVFGSIFILLAAGAGVYTASLRRSARELIQSAQEIRSTIDANRQIASWRQRSGRGYSESKSPDGAGRAYQFEIGNGAFSKLHLAPSTGLMLEIVLQGDELQLVVLGMYTPRSSVWVQEDFSATNPWAASVNTEQDDSGTPLKTVVMVGAKVAEKKREVFDLNYSCLVRLGGCKSAAEILPALPQLTELYPGGWATLTGKYNAGLPLNID